MARLKMASFFFRFFLKKETRWLSIGADIDRLARLVFISGLEIVREHSRVWVRGVREQIVKSANVLPRRFPTSPPTPGSTGVAYETLASTPQPFLPPSR